MYKKILALLLCAALLLFSGCSGETSSSDASSSSEASATVTPEPTPTPKPTPTPTPEPASGIVLMTVDSQDGQQQVQLFCIDPDTGAKSPLALFVIPSSCDIAAMPIMYASMPLFEGAASGKFSNDFSELAITYSLPDSTEEHAGWLNEEGDFIDVITTLGLQSQSDFSDPPIYQALGFTNDNYFIFEEFREHTYYMVPVDAVAPENLIVLETIDDVAIAFGAPANLEDTTYEAWYANDQFTISDSIDNNQYLASYSIDKGSKPISCMTAFSKDGTTEKVEYLPNAKRFTWSATLNPSGTQIAFLSCTSEEPYQDKKTDLFVVPLDGGEPTQIPCELPDTQDYKRTNGVYTLVNADIDEAHYYCAIVGWI